MKGGLDQLQSVLETILVHMKAEVEELQQELMYVQSKGAKYEREILVYKIKLDELKI